MLSLLTAAALAQDSGWPAPNAMIRVGVGVPWSLAVHGESMISDGISGEIGGGVAGVDAPFDLGSGLDPGFDWALRWRPDALCLGCGGRALVVLEVGVGGLVDPDPKFEQWGLAAGLDVDADLVFWASRATGLDVGLRLGAGPSFALDGFAYEGIVPWGFFDVGAAF